ncbi:hypothetical protein FACS1894211_16830 [Clostridia bacterium]|nr:hypothetical protein FACS1894211_16830 [Clostridia bacterium]
MSEKMKNDLTQWIQKAQDDIKNKSDTLLFLNRNGISAEKFDEALSIKRESAQIDIKIHAYGIVLALQRILDESEQIESLSLGAGNKGKPFDLKTSKRVAEFKFAEWRESHGTIRQNAIFQNFLELAVHRDDNGRKKYIYCYGADRVKKFLSGSQRSLNSVLSRNSVNKKHEEYRQRYETVKGFYEAYKNEVEIIELEDLLK